MLKKSLKYKIQIAIVTFMAITSLGVGAQTPNDSVTISGRVTDFKGIPIDSCTVMWQNEQFEPIAQALTDINGFYSVRISKGKYNSVTAIYWPSYAQNAMTNGLPVSEHRLEFWGWNFIADRDTTLNIRYHRMEAYGLHAFYIPGATPAFQIYVRPMSLTRTYEWMVKQQSNTNDTRSAKLSPSHDEIRVRVEIDGKEVAILHKQEIDEYIGDNQTFNAYLLTVEKPQYITNWPYWVIKVELTDLQNGDCGEGLYYLEKPDYIK